jgi:hypothetical protein
MIHELETKIIEAYLNKEITLLEKEVGVRSAWTCYEYYKANPLQKQLSVNEIYNLIMEEGKVQYSELEKQYTKEELLDLAIQR